MQFHWQGALWGLPNTATPDVLFNDTKISDVPGLAYPTDDWTYDDMRQAVMQLTLDSDGRTPEDISFDPETVEQET